MLVQISAVQEAFCITEPTLADLETALAVGLLAFVLIKTTKFVLKIRKETFRYEIGDR